MDPRKKSVKISFYGYWRQYMESKMSYPTFRKEIHILLSDPSFVKDFGTYKFRTLNREQLKLLNREFRY